MIYNLVFVKNSLLKHALLSIVESIQYNLDNKTFSCRVFVDLQKAFTVNHDILLNKLNHYGIRGNSLEWISTYLSNRNQSDSCNGVKSNTLNINCGVP